MWVTIPQIIVQKQAAKGDLSFFDQSPADKRKSRVPATFQ